MLQDVKLSSGIGGFQASRYSSRGATLQEWAKRAAILIKNVLYDIARLSTNKSFQNGKDQS